MADGIQNTQSRPDPAEAAGKALLGLCCAGALFNPGGFDRAMGMTVGGPSFSGATFGGPSAFAGVTNMFGGMTNTVLAYSQQIATWSMASTIAQSVNPAPDRKQQNMPKPTYMA